MSGTGKSVYSALVLSNGITNLADKRTFSLACMRSSVAARRRRTPLEAGRTSPVCGGGGRAPPVCGGSGRAPPVCGGGGDVVLRRPSPVLVSWMHTFGSRSGHAILLLDHSAPQKERGKATDPHNTGTRAGECRQV
jgi:hypothetical protein